MVPVEKAAASTSAASSMNATSFGRTSAAQRAALSVAAYMGMDRRGRTSIGRVLPSAATTCISQAVTQRAPATAALASRLSWDETSIPPI